MSPRNLGPTLPDGEALAQFKDYREAVSYVERLIENDFPAQLVSIVGTDLRTVEVIRGKLGYGRVALSGALTGSWIGMFFGLVFGTTGEINEELLVTNLFSGIVIGAGLGMLLNVIRFALTKQKRSFISGQSVVAKKYEVVVPKDRVEAAKKASIAKVEVKKAN